MDVEQTPSKQKHRGKLYALSDDSAWEDTGTGHASVTGSGDSRRFIFQEEESGRVLHDRPVFDSSIYQLQGEGERQTIIVWEDAETQKDWALSFQDPDGTAEIWEGICGDAAADEKRVLPLPTLANLGELCRLLTCVPPNLREVLAAECMSAKFLNGLRDTFHTAEDVCSEEALAALWQITKGIFLLSNQKLTERYLKQDVYEDVLGMLEHDAGLPSDKRIAHRDTFKVQVCFKDVLTFEDADILERIHLNYRLQYLKDIALPRLLDDAAFVSLTQMIHMNLSIILDHLQKSQRVLEQLFTQIRQKDQQSLHFLQDVCRLAKQIAPSERQILHEKMVANHFFATLVPFFGEEDGASASRKEANLHHACVELLLISAHNDPVHLRRFLTAEEGGTEGKTLMTALIQTVHHGEDQGVQGQAAELLKLVMEVATLEPRDRDACLDTFYDRGALDELTAALRTDGAVKQAVTPGGLFGQQLSCELLAFAVMHHGFRARVHVMRHGVVQHAVRLLSAPQRFLQLAPVRLLQAAVGTKDEAYHKYLVKSGFFAPLLRAFEQSVRPPALGGNLLVSATLQVLEFIRVENIKLLVGHICGKHEALLREHSAKFRTLQQFLLKHQQNLEYEAFPPERHAAGGVLADNSSHSGVSRSGRRRSPGREDSDDDEAYFESLDDDEDENGSARRTGAATTSAPAPAQLEQSPDSTSSHASASQDGALAPALARGDGEAGALESSSASLQGLLRSYADEEKEEAAVGEDASNAVGLGSKACDTANTAECRSNSSSTVSATAHAASASGTAAQQSSPEALTSASVADLRGVVGSQTSDSAPTKLQTAGGEDRTAVANSGLSGAADSVVDACNASAEKALNHAPKRLKTSAATVEAPV